MTHPSPFPIAPQARDVAPFPAQAVDAGAPSLAARTWAVAPGLALTAGIAAAAVLVVRLPGASGVSPMTAAMVIGIALRNTIGLPNWALPGAGFSVRRLLRIAIVLLGLQLTVAQLAAIGTRGIFIIGATLAATFVVTLQIGRRLGVDRRLTELIAAGTAICGASAVVATNTVTRAPDEDVGYAVACVTIFGSAAMLAYPWLQPLLGLDPQGYGLWAGASIHEVAQAVAAGFQGGPEAGEFATIAKLARVTALAPVVLGLALLTRRGAPANAAARAKPPMPWFVLGFVAMVALGSMVAVPAGGKAALATLTSFLLATALAAMGLDTDLRKLAARGWRPALLGALASLFIATFSLALIKLTG